MKVIEIKDADLIAFLHGVCQYSPIINNGAPEGKQIKEIVAAAQIRLEGFRIAFLQIEEKYFDCLEKALELSHHAYCNVPLNDRVIDNETGKDIVGIYFQWMEPKVRELRNAMKVLTNKTNTLIH